MSRHFWSIVLIIASSNSISAAKGDAEVDYTRDIKPILSNHCYACHGPDANQRKAELRLDLPEDALASAIVPGKADESEIIHRVTSNDPDEKMPPVSSKKPSLHLEEIDLLRKWISQGAKFDMHWAYRQLDRPDVPNVDYKIWPKNEIDNFIGAEHRKLGFKSSSDADQRILSRRLHFDLIGLPPKPEQVDAFLADKSPEAYEKLVDQLLESDHFGERMAIFWLDLVRYADTNGIHSDNHREHDLYREYVINSFNANKRFDQFTIEQLAGDLIPGATKEQRVASGYNRLNLTTQEGGAQAKEYIAKYAADRVRNASVVWLGSTLGCAQCHDHKFDPFTTKDFYSFAAFFADVQETPVGKQQPARIPTDEQERQVKSLDEELAKLRNVLNTQTPQLEAALAKWEEATRAKLESGVSDWVVLKPEKTESSGGATFVVQEDQSVLSSGENPAKDTYTVTLKTNQEKITGIRLEALTHSSFGNQSLSRSNGNFVLTRFEVETLSNDGQPKQAKIKSAAADFSQNGFPVANAIDGKANTGWAVNGHGKKESRKAVFAFEQPLAGSPETTIIVRMRHESQYAQHNIGRFRLALTSVDQPSLKGVNGIPDNIAQLVVMPRDKRSQAQHDLLAKHFRSICEELAPTRGRVAELDAKRKKFVDAYRPILVSMSTTPRMVRVLPRGNWLDDSGEVVQPAVPEFLGNVGVEAGRASRMDLARWIIRPDNPLVARTFANRLWKLCFGNGIVTSLDDFGAQGTLPSHPELLDWLAVEFIESGWDIKHLVKLMVMSRTYRQSSIETKELRERDPKNNWLARQNRFRFDAELVRDNALAVSGLLVHKLGGPSVKPYQPAGYWAHLNFPRRSWKHDSGDNQYRRGLYTYWCRTFPHPSLLAFDAQTREETCVQRPRSNTPLQALVLLNDPTYVEAARAFAVRMIQEGGKAPSELIEFAFRQALNRQPRLKEQELLVHLFEKHLDEYAANSEAATQLIKTGESKPPDEFVPAELAAWTSVARVILNLHETITRN